MGKTILSSFLMAVAAVFLFATAGCGKHVESPRDLVSKAELTLQQAEAANAREIAPLEMRVATEKLGEAKEAMRKEKFKEARYLAQEAMAQAQLAEVKGRALTAEKNVIETKKNLNALRKEANK